MGAKCSSGMADSLHFKDEAINAVEKAVRDMVPALLRFQVTGNKQDFENCEKYIKSKDTIFVYSSGKLATAKDVRESTGKSSFAKADLVSVDNVTTFVDKMAAVATMTVSCGYEMQPGLYKVVQNTYTMKSSSMQSEQVTNLDANQKVEVQKVVRVGERLRGQLQGRNEWITLQDKSKPDTKFVELIKSKGAGTQQFTYTTVLELVDVNENEKEWRLVQLTMQSKA